MGVFYFYGYAQADTLGQNHFFHIDPKYSLNSQTGINATLRVISSNTYIYTEDTYWSSLGSYSQQQLTDKINQIAQEFDFRIYPIETAFFGSEPNPGIDNDSHITILLTPLKQTVGGYFNSGNQNRRTIDQTSNQREMIYININSLNIDNELRRIYSLLAHEFQHLISFNQKELKYNLIDDIWLNELRSEYAISLLGYNEPFENSSIQRRISKFETDSSDTLTEWKNLEPDYSQIALFGEYIADKWSPRVIADTLNVQAVGIQSLNMSLNKNGYQDSFADLFNSWSIANKLNYTKINPKFGYDDPDLTQFRTSAAQRLYYSTAYPNTISDSIKDWQAKWYEISNLQASGLPSQGPQNVLKITFNTTNINQFKIFYIAEFLDGSRKVYFFNTSNSQNTLYIKNINNVRQISILSIPESKFSNFTTDETAIPINITLEAIVSAQDNIPTGQEIDLDSDPRLAIESMYIKDGDLLRSTGDPKVYLIKGSWRRHILNEKVFFANGWDFKQVKEGSSDIMNRYKESSLIRAGILEKVYDIDSKGVYHWLQMSERQFLASNRIPESIFDAMTKELAIYKSGGNIIK